MLVGTNVCVWVVFVWEETHPSDLMTTWPSHMPGIEPGSQRWDASANQTAMLYFPSFLQTDFNFKVTNCLFKKTFFISCSILKAEKENFQLSIWAIFSNTSKTPGHLKGGKILIKLLSRMDKNFLLRKNIDKHQKSINYNNKKLVNCKHLPVAILLNKLIWWGWYLVNNGWNQLKNIWYWTYTKWHKFIYLFLLYIIYKITKSWYMYNSALQRLPTEMPCNGPQLSNYHSFIAYSKTKQFIRFIYQTKQAYCNFWLFFTPLFWQVVFFCQCCR